MFHFACIKSAVDMVFINISEAIKQRKENQVQESKAKNMSIAWNEDK